MLPLIQVCRLLQAIIQKLLDAGAEANIPFIVIEQATTPNQNVQSFTLESFLNNPSRNFASPSIIIIGKVAELHQQFSWFQHQQGSPAYFRSVDAETNYLRIQSFIQQKNIEHANGAKTAII